MKTLTAVQVASGVGFTEGPLIRANGEVLYVSIDQERLYRIKDGKNEVFAELPGSPNGATEGLDGTVYVTQSGGRWGGNKNPDWHLHSGIQGVGLDGKVEWVSTDPIAPNDLCFGPDGFLWVTDPTRYKIPRVDGRLFRIDPKTGQAEILCSLGWYPNGIGFGLEDDAVYVADSSESHRMVRFPIQNGKLGKPEVFCEMGHYSPDGFLFDAEGNLVTSANSHGDGPGQIQTFDRNGKLIDAFEPGSKKVYANVALDANRRMIITASQDGAVLEVRDWPHAGLPLHPFRKKK